MTFIGSVSWSICHLVLVRGMCPFCSRASRRAVSWDFSGGNTLQISQLDLIIPKKIMVSDLEYIDKYLRVILTQNFGLYDEWF